MAGRQSPKVSLQCTRPDLTKFLPFVLSIKIWALPPFFWWQITCKVCVCVCVCVRMKPNLSVRTSPLGLHVWSTPGSTDNFSLYARSTRTLYFSVTKAMKRYTATEAKIQLTKHIRTWNQVPVPGKSNLKSSSRFDDWKSRNPSSVYDKNQWMSTDQIKVQKYKSKQDTRKKFIRRNFVISRC